MKFEFRLMTAAIIAAVLVSAPLAEGVPFRPLDEKTALALLERTLKRDRVYEKRISWDCIAYGTEETTNAFFEFVLRETHNAKCGGDPETSPAIDRYRVCRRSGKIEQWQATDDTWQTYKRAQLSSVKLQGVRKSRPLERARPRFSADSNVGDRRLRSNVFRPLSSPVSLCCTPL
jgi:hypothetical protein